jgi:hypothetical protein
VSNNTNQHIDNSEGHDLNPVIMTRTAQKRETIAEFGYEREDPSSVRMRKIWEDSRLIEHDVKVSAKFLAESLDVVDGRSYG